MHWDVSSKHRYDDKSRTRSDEAKRDERTCRDLRSGLGSHLNSCNLSRGNGGWHLRTARGMVSHWGQ